MTPTKSKSSQGAGFLAMKIYQEAHGPSEAAHLIDAELAELMDAALAACHWHDDSLACHEAHEKLATLILKWRIEG